MFSEHIERLQLKCERSNGRDGRRAIALFFFGFGSSNRWDCGLDRSA
jgi:hypothetical protein